MSCVNVAFIIRMSSVRHVVHSPHQAPQSDWQISQWEKYARAGQLLFMPFRACKKHCYAVIQQEKRGHGVSSSVRMMGASLEGLLSKPTFTPQTLIIYKNWLCMSPMCSDDISSPSCLLIRHRQREAGNKQNSPRCHPAAQSLGRWEKVVWPYGSKCSSCPCRKGLLLGGVLSNTLWPNFPVHHWNIYKIVTGGKKCLLKCRTTYANMVTCE